MRYVSELIGGVFLLVIVFLGMKHAFQLLERRESDNVDVQHEKPERRPTDRATGVDRNADA